jgi:hypothetical protein
MGPQSAFASAHVFGLQAFGSSPPSLVGANPPLEDVFPLLLLLLDSPPSAPPPFVKVLVLSLPHAAIVKANVPARTAATTCQRMCPPRAMAHALCPARARSRISDHIVRGHRATIFCAARDSFLVRRRK